MKDKLGVAHCASTFEKNGCPLPTVYAVPVFVPVTISVDDLPLRELYNHPDFIDIISTQEFGIEYTSHEKLLLCVIAAAAPESLHEMAEMITPTGRLVPCASCSERNGTLNISAMNSRFSISVEESSEAFSAAVQGQQLPVVLAALTSWCTGYACTLYWEAAQ